VAKVVRLDPVNVDVAIKTNDNLLSGMLQHELNILRECGGRGRCATCHVFIKDGMDALSPISRREQRTLEVITTCRTNSRLACQARVLGEGVTVELPGGMYLSQVDDVESLIGRRAQQSILHPIYGTILVEEGKLITRTMITQLQDTQGEIKEYLSTTENV
jgi:ferredoxin